MGGSPFWTQEKGLAAAFGSGFQEALSYNGTLYFIHGNGQTSGTCGSSGYECCPYEAGCLLGDGVADAGPFYYHDYDDQWVCFEIKMHSDGTKKLYITTADQIYNGLYMQATDGVSGTPAITGFGGAYFHDSGAAADSYIMVDEVVIADSYIGPPTGFLGTTAFGSGSGSMSIGGGSGAATFR